MRESTSQSEGERHQREGVRQTYSESGKEMVIIKIISNEKFVEIVLLVAENVIFTYEKLLAMTSYKCRG